MEWIIASVTVAFITVSAVTILKFSNRSPISELTLITVELTQLICPLDPRIYGHFTEETLTSYEGGVSSELFNRKFEMPEERTRLQSTVREIIHRHPQCDISGRFCPANYGQNASPNFLA
jgi:hypothetical protein